MTNYAVNTTYSFADIYCLTQKRISMYWVYIKQWFFNVTSNRSAKFHNCYSIKMRSSDYGNRVRGTERLVDIKVNSITF